MVKLLGAAIVIISGGVLGFYRASRERKRLEQGIELKRLLYLLQGEIRYGLTPLPDAIGTIAGKMNAEFSVRRVKKTFFLSGRNIFPSVEEFCGEGSHTVCPGEKDAGAIDHHGRYDWLSGQGYAGEDH